MSNTIKLEFEVFCLECGEKLDAFLDDGIALTVSVSPCPKCMKEAYDRGIDLGATAYK